MNCLSPLVLSLTLVARGSLAGSAQTAEPAHIPNLIFMLADDLGWGDLNAKPAYETYKKTKDWFAPRHAPPPAISPLP